MKTDSDTKVNNVIYSLWREYSKVFEVNRFIRTRNFLRKSVRIKKKTPRSLIHQSMQGSREPIISF